ncbi:MAG TPA: hypothetical protein VKE69_02535 [Planctomycetota bacterium]|nr:hypothetical protein [Planctomycetota bacterium]
MKTLVAAALVSLFSSALGCQSSRPHATPHDDAARKPLFDAVKSLEGSWEMVGEDGTKGVTEFRVTSAGSVVREVMFPGGDHEMTNMYHLDGNALVLTHYCAMGNQPRMRAEKRDGDRLLFRSDSVGDLAPGQGYMGEMTLELVDRDHMAQTWRFFEADGGSHETRFAFSRTSVAAR